MVAELGHFALILGFVVAILVTIVPLVGAYMRWPGWMRFSETGSNALFLLTVTSFGALTYAFVVSDFSVKLVWMNSHTAKPMLYKITGVWGNHEGSMLLWVLILNPVKVMYWVLMSFLRLSLWTYTLRDFRLVLTPFCLSPFWISSYPTNPSICF